MRNHRGITLIEVLASVTILAIAVLAMVYILQQSTLFSKQNNDKENNVQVARSVMEEIKINLKPGTPINPFGSSIQISALKGVPVVALPLFYSSAAQTVRIEVKSLTLPATASNNLNIKGTNYNINTYFRLVQVTCTNVQTSKSYSLQAYVEIN